eukprot:Hpha_TRINITY_DN16472_c0_g5::TRINITY_DN16472_c0_g5_i2::g.160704::m.160704
MSRANVSSFTSSSKRRLATSCTLARYSPAVSPGWGPSCGLYMAWSIFGPRSGVTVGGARASVVDGGASGGRGGLSRGRGGEGGRGRGRVAGGAGKVLGGTGRLSLPLLPAPLRLLSLLFFLLPPPLLFLLIPFFAILASLLRTAPLLQEDTKTPVPLCRVALRVFAEVPEEFALGLDELVVLLLERLDYRRDTLVEVRCEGGETVGGFQGVAGLLAATQLDGALQVLNVFLQCDLVNLSRPVDRLELLVEIGGVRVFAVHEPDSEVKQCALAIGSSERLQLRKVRHLNALGAGLGRPNVEEVAQLQNSAQDPREEGATLGGACRVGEYLHTLPDRREGALEAEGGAPATQAETVTGELADHPEVLHRE